MRKSKAIKYIVKKYYVVLLKQHYKNNLWQYINVGNAFILVY